MMGIDILTYGAAKAYTDAHGGGGAANAVLYIEQELDWSQQEQARSNISAAPLERGLPAWTASDEGKFLKIVNGAPAWRAIESAEGVAF